MMIASLGYEDGGNFIHSPSNEDMLSVSFDVLKGNGFPVCQTVDFTISPFLLALGVYSDGDGDGQYKLRKRSFIKEEQTLLVTTNSIFFLHHLCVT